MVRRLGQLTTSNGIILDCLSGHDTSDTSENGGSLERRRNVASFSVDLTHEDTNLEGTVDLAVLHEISSHNAILNDVRVPPSPGRVAGIRRKTAAPHPPRRGDFLDKRFTLLDIFAEIQPDGT